MSNVLVRLDHVARCIANADHSIIAVEASTGRMGERSSVLTHIAVTESVSLCVRMKS